MKIIAFAASTNSKSINKQLIEYASKLLDKVYVEILDLNNYEMPLYSQDRENESGHPQLAKDLLEKIGGSDGLIISFAEHNGSYTAAYKNIFDWCSRIEPKVFQNKPMVLLAASPGAMGASSVLASAENSAPYFNGIVKASLSIPNFYDNFDIENKLIKNNDLNKQFINAVCKLNNLK